MKRRRANIALLFFLLLGRVCAASTTPAPHHDALPDIVVQTDDGQTSALGALLRSVSRGPVLFLPLFTRCSSSCPTLLHKLESSLAVPSPRSRVRVLLFSFDPTETQATLSTFRSTSGIPADWILAHADEGATRALLQYLNYPVMSRGAVFIHPSEVFVLDNDIRWRWTLAGTDWGPKDLSQVVERSESPDFMTRIEARPEAVVWAALGLALGGICLVVAFWSRTLKTPTVTLRSSEFAARSDTD